MRYAIEIGAVVMFSCATASLADMGFDQRYERDYNIFNPANHYAPDNPLNPTNTYNPSVPFEPLDGWSGGRR